MKTDRRLTGFLLLQNSMLNAFVRQGLADRSLGVLEAERLSRLEALNLQEITRWKRDLHLTKTSCTVGRDDRG